jgi:hypothetical protein
MGIFIDAKLAIEFLGYKSWDMHCITDSSINRSTKLKGEELSTQGAVRHSKLRSLDTAQIFAGYHNHLTLRPLSYDSPNGHFKAISSLNNQSAETIKIFYQ